MNTTLLSTKWSAGITTVSCNNNMNMVGGVSKNIQVLENFILIAGSKERLPKKFSTFFKISSRLIPRSHGLDSVFLEQSIVEMVILSGHCSFLQNIQTARLLFTTDKIGTLQSASMDKLKSPRNHAGIFLFAFLFKKVTLELVIRKFFTFRLGGFHVHGNCSTHQGGQGL